MRIALFLLQTCRIFLRAAVSHLNFSDTVNNKPVTRPASGNDDY
jgi:hypothetical protein